MKPNRQKRTLPAVIDIDGYQIKVVAEQPRHRPDAIGEFDEKDYTIRVRPVQSGGPVMELDTLFHELIHTISRVRLPAEHDLSELQVWTLAGGLAAMLARNPLLVGFLRGKLNEAQKDWGVN